MAIAGAGGWIPSAAVKLKNGRLNFATMTQNKPAYILEQDPEEAARRLLLGETVTIDIREQFTAQVLNHIHNAETT